MNFTTTEYHIIQALSTAFFSTFSDENVPHGPKGPTGPKGGNHTDILEWKQTLSIVSVVSITTLITLTLLQILKKIQLTDSSAKILFMLFIIGLIMFIINSIVFTYFIFNMDTFSEDTYVMHLIFSMIPYRIGKFVMSLFFILRLHFVFAGSALRVNIRILSILIISAIIGTLLGCAAGIIGPLKVIHHKPDDKRINPSLAISYASLSIIILVDIIVLIYYLQRLQQIILNQSKIFEKPVKKCSMTGAIVTDVIELQPTSKIITKQRTYEMINKVPTIQEIIETHVWMDDELLYTMTKSTLLSIIGIVSSFWLHFEMFVMAINGSTDGVLFRAIASMDGAINIICMYLIFAFAKPYYNFGCKWCHIGMSKCCVCVTKKVILTRDKSDEFVD